MKRTKRTQGAAAPQSEGFALLPIANLRPGQSQQRRFFTDLEALASQIEESGWIQVLEVKPDGEILSGERRFRAASILNDRATKSGKEIPWPSLPCMVVATDGDKAEFDANVRENSGRCELRFIEWATIFRKYREEHGLSNGEISKRTGFEETTVSRYLTVSSKLCPAILDRLNNGEQIPVNALINIHRISDPNIQLLRLNQWLGNPAPETDEPKTRERKAGLSRRQQLAVLKVLQESEASDETIETVQFLVGLRQTLPHKWHLKLSRRRRQRRTD